MNIITADFETFYSRAYSLSKMTTEEYIRDPRFQVIGVSVKVNEDVPVWFSGTARETLEWLHGFDWESSALVAHNAMFDAAILSWRCGIRPARIIDTLSMSRAMFGVDASHSLKSLAERLGLPAKGDEVTRAIGKRRADFTADELHDYGEYCRLDVHLTYEAFRKMALAKFPMSELKLIDLTLKMFTDPVLELDVAHLQGHLQRTQHEKEQMLVDAGISDRKDLLSNQKFADLLRGLGVEPPMKTSPATGKPTYAFAKNDEDFQALSEHDDPRVQTIVSARLGTKSTLEETRTERFIAIGQRGKFPVPLRYYAAHTGRWGGTDKINMQNLPSRGPNAKQLKKAIRAPEGYMLADCDSSQIEARVLAWLAEQDDLVAAFARGEDVYKIMASKIYGIDVAAIDKGQRQVGKTVILGAGYGVGHNKLQLFLKTQAGVDVDLDEAKRIIDIYRHSNSQISGLWKSAQRCIEYMERGDAMRFGRPGVLDVAPDDKAIILPNGLPIRYDGLFAEQGEKGYEYQYKTRRGPKRLYGGACVENVTQALARIVVGEQMLKIAKRYRVVLTVHDSVVSCVPEAEVDEARDYIETCMRWTPDWAEGLPVNCESGVGQSYGACD
jgi:DNA polymerase